MSGNNYGGGLTSITCLGSHHYSSVHIDAKLRTPLLHAPNSILSLDGPRFTVPSSSWIITRLGKSSLDILYYAKEHRCPKDAPRCTVPLLLSTLSKEKHIQFMCTVPQLFILDLLLVKLVLTSTTACVIIRAVVLMLYIQQVWVLRYYSTIIPYILTLVCDELPTVFFRVRLSKSSSAPCTPHTRVF